MGLSTHERSPLEGDDCPTRGYRRHGEDDRVRDTKVTMTHFGGVKEGKCDKLDQRRVQFSRKARLH